MSKLSTITLKLSTIVAKLRFKSREKEVIKFPIKTGQIIEDVCPVCHRYGRQYLWKTAKHSFHGYGIDHFWECGVCGKDWR